MKATLFSHYCFQLSSESSDSINGDYILSHKLKSLNFCSALDPGKYLPDPTFSIHSGSGFCLIYFRNIFNEMPTAIDVFSLLRFLGLNKLQLSVKGELLLCMNF